MNFTPRAVILFTVSIINILLAAFIFWQYRKRKIAKVFSLASFFAAAYSWTLAGMAAAPTAQFAWQWFRFSFPFGCFVVIGYFHFALVFSRQDQGNRVYTNLLKIGYGLAMLMGLLRLFDVLPGVVVRRADQSWHIEHDRIYLNLFIPYIFFFMPFSLYVVLRKYRKTVSAAEKNQLRFFFLAIGLSFVLGMVNITRVPYLGSLSGVAYTGILAYAITRHRLFDLNLVIKKGAFGAALSFVACLAFVLIFVLVQRLLNWADDTAAFLGGLGAAFIITLLFGPVKNWTAKLVNQLLDIRTLSPTERLLEYASLFNDHVRLSSYLSALCQKLYKDLGLENARVLFKSPNNSQFVVWAAFPPEGGLEKSGRLQHLEENAALPQHLAKAKSAVDLEELLSSFELQEDEEVLPQAAKDEIAAELKSLEAQIAFPVLIRGSLEAVLLLGPKVSGTLYSRDDMVFLAAITGDIAQAIENSRLSEQLQQKDRLSILGTLSASMAHEIRNPLAAVRLILQMMPERINEEGFQKRLLEILPKEMDRMYQLTERLMTFSRQQNGQFVQVDLNGLCSALYELTRYQFNRKQLRLELKLCQGNPPCTLGSEAELSQVLLNLLLNALQATPEKGEVYLSVEWPKKDWVSIVVRDTGCGIPQNQIHKIFEPFFTTKAEGTGLGLPTCQRVVGEHKGRITVESEPGKGSVFTVWLPAAVNGSLVAPEEQAAQA